MRTFDFFLVKEKCNVSRFSCSSWDWVNEGFSRTLRLRHPFVLRCNGSAASSSVPRYAAPTSPLRATLQRQRCVFVGASLRCTYVTPSRYAATEALRDVSRAATLQRSSARMDFYKRMDRRTVERWDEAMPVELCGGD